MVAVASPLTPVGGRTIAKFLTPLLGSRNSRVEIRWSARRWLFLQQGRAIANFSILPLRLSKFERRWCSLNKGGPSPIFKFRFRGLCDRIGAGSPRMQGDPSPIFKFGFYGLRKSIGAGSPHM